MYYRFTNPDGISLSREKTEEEVKRFLSICFLSKVKSFLSEVMKNRVDKSLSIISLIVCLSLFSCSSEYYYLRRGIFNYNEGRYDQAISDFTRTLEINPKLGNVYYNRGAAYWVKGEYDNAISDFNKALEINPRDPDAYISRGGVYIKKDQPDHAIPDFNKALELDPKSAEAYLNRGIAYYLKREYDKSWQDVKKARNLGYQIPPEFLEELRKTSGRQD